MNVDEEMDASGLLCPLPVLKLRKRVKALKTGSVIKIYCDDPAAELDIPHFCLENSHTILKKSREHGKSGITFYIQKA